VPSLDLGAYLERIGWSGEAPATLETLSRLIRAHMSSIAFENLDVLLGRPVRLDLGSATTPKYSKLKSGTSFWSSLKRRQRRGPQTSRRPYETFFRLS
jgi:N-hydroxyarylamine O-acetyltransferase